VSGLGTKTIWTYPLFVNGGVTLELLMINEALRLLRIYHDMSQTELATQLNLSNSYVSELESGKKQPTLDLLEKYAKHFQIPVSSLLFFSEQLTSKTGSETVRKGVARKVLSLLNWVVEKNERPHTGKKKAA
jgi:transcriptional regulator with XRE-family HTH domain